LRNGLIIIKRCFFGAHSLHHITANSGIVHITHHPTTAQNFHQRISERVTHCIFKKKSDTTLNEIDEKKVNIITLMIIEIEKVTKDNNQSMHNQR
jgi:hypothetical protein